MSPSLRTTRLSLLFATVLALAFTTIVTTSGRAHAADVVLDGSTQARAAVSCWEIKQIKPASTDGTYWLLTPELKAPRRFYCDMTTDGGGWVLVGRGRNGWSYAYNGRGTSDQVADTVTGTAAFDPKQLDSNVIDALLGGRRLDAVSPELRVQRALNTSGSQWQDLRLTFAKAERWTWALHAGVPVSSARINGSTIATNSTTRDLGSNSTWNRMTTITSSANKYVRGFNYGSGATGSTSASSYLYSEAGNGGYATPFTQLFIRPKLRKADVTFSAIPASGTAESTLPAVPENGTAASTWGVTGTGAAGTGENATEVQAFAQVGNTMFAGGNFTTVQRGADASGSNVVAQRYLAAFDASTANYLPSFQPPVLNNQVKALAALPGNRLAVGGEFTTVDGRPRAGFVVLDATTGAVDEAWTASILNKLSGGTVSIRALDVYGDYLYLGGAMTHFSTPTGEVYAKGGGRIKISTRQPDSNWNPEFNGTATALDVSTDGTRVYYAGYFTQSRGTAADRAAAFSTDAGAARITPTWQPTFSTAGSARYQQAVKEAGSKVWLGGSQHSMFSYDRDTFVLQDKHVTKSGGDLQAIDAGNGYVYGGCHCEEFNFSGTSNYDSLSPGQYSTQWTYADSIYYIGAWDASTGQYAADFSPEMRARNGMGVWAIKVADDGTVWAGGSLQSAVATSGKNQWVGGFARFTIRDHAAPDTPTALTATVTGSTATASWHSSGGSETYEVLRNDRVVATSSSTSVEIPDSAVGDRFFVRAVDARGNRSASTAAVTATQAISTTTLLPQGATWKYRFDSSAVASGWQSRDFDASAWKSGAAPLGFGGDVATDVDVPSGSTRGVVSYYRNTFTIPAGTTVGDVSVTTRADDGVAVYVNGTEVGRSNLPDGALTDATYALSSPRTSAAVASPVTFTIPHDVLVQGNNTIAISTHALWKATPDTSMDATVVATAGTFAPPAPATTTQLVAEQSTWSYLFSATTAAPATWTTSAIGTEAWKSGAAPLGWGTGPIATNIDVPGTETRGLTSYFRKTFTISNPAAISALTLTTRADDGVAVYINGVEVGRSRLPDGTLTSGTYATSAVNTAAALADPVVITVPPSVLTSGTNTIAVEVHSNYKATPSQSMDLRLVAIS